MNQQERTIYGRLGKNPELRMTKKDKPYCTFTLAEENAGNEEPRWHNVVMWEKDSEHWAKSLKKGAEVFVHGRIQEKVFNDKAYSEVNADAIGLTRL